MTLLQTEIQAITNDYEESGTTDIFFEDNVLLWMLMNGSKFQEGMVTAGELADGGEKIRVILEYAKTHSGSYGNTTSIPQSKVKILNAARYRWAGYFASNAIDLNDQIQNTGDAAIVDMVQAKLKNIKMSIRDKMGDDIYDEAANSNSFLGLGDLFLASTSTRYGNIAEDDMSLWAPQTTSASLTIGLKTLQRIRRLAQVGQSKSEKPNLYITTDTLKDGYERTLNSQVRYRDEKIANAGFDHVLFGQVPVVADDKQTASRVDALNLNYLKVKTHSKYMFTTPVWEYDKEQPDTLVANQRWIGQLITSRRAAHARATSISEPS